jgi:hypothetical protein
MLKDSFVLSALFVDLDLQIVHNAVGQKPQNSISTYNPMGQSGNKPNYSGGGMMGNMSTGSTFGGQSYGM